LYRSTYSQKYQSKTFWVWIYTIPKRFGCQEFFATKNFGVFFKEDCTLFLFHVMYLQYPRKAKLMSELCLGRHPCGHPLENIAGKGVEPILYGAYWLMMPLWFSFIPRAKLLNQWRNRAPVQVALQAYRAPSVLHQAFSLWVLY